MHSQGLNLGRVMDHLGQIEVNAAMVTDEGLNGLAGVLGLLGPQGLPMPVLLVLNVGETLACVCGWAASWMWTWMWTWMW